MLSMVPAPANKSPIAEIKNGKVIFRQKPISFEKSSETMQEIVKFREMLDHRVNETAGPLTSIPHENKPLVVKLAQESDKTAVALAKQIRSIILPGQGEVGEACRTSLESCLPLPVVEHAIKTMMTRVNYGLVSPLGQKLPAAACVWRWEVQDSFKDWLPKSARESVEARIEERIQAREHLSAVFASLPQAQQDAILDPKGTNKLPVKDINQTEAPHDLVSDNLDGQHSQTDNTVTPIKNQTQSENVAPRGRLKKATDWEKAAKVKEKEEKMVAKAEKQKKQKDAQDKSRSIMANFFGKAKSSTLPSPTKEPYPAAGPSSTENDFQRTFKPYVVKKDAELAPQNWFMETSKKVKRLESGATHDDAIIVDYEFDSGTESQEGLPLRDGLDAASAPAELQDILPLLVQRSLTYPKKRKVTSFKTYNARTIRDIMAQLNDAEIAGDPSQVRHLLSILSDRKLLPAKVLIFNEDARPGYYGTWTRNSRIIGPRTPFSRDLLARDYGYDSGEEWEHEDVSQADDVVDDDDDDQEGDEPDSDLDSWLVDDDEVETPTPLDLGPLSPPMTDVHMPPPKRKAENLAKPAEKKRRVVVPLVPFSKGPCWESAIGQCEYEPFDAYRIQLFNDTPHPIDPFTFVSVAAEERQNIKVDPSVPNKSVQVQSGPVAALPGKRVSAGQATKAPFPEAHLGTLLAKIVELATPSLTYLVESIYQDLRIHKVKKNAIETKVREVSEKSKVWVVKEAVRVSSDGYIRRTDTNRSNPEAARVDVTVMC
ncbi:hypothetical protein ID866_3930 [Astraeus odoratus]|nr:hypothetical protein ID866_3930 [Astraeus odoratus]